MSYSSNEFKKWYKFEGSMSTLLPAVLDTSAVLQGKSRLVAEHKGGGRWREQKC
jgi:hypothetical protein